MEYPESRSTFKKNRESPDWTGGLTHPAWRDIGDLAGRGEGFERYGFKLIGLNPWVWFLDVMFLTFGANLADPGLADFTCSAAGIMNMSANPDHPWHVACGNNKMLRDDPKEKGRWCWCWRAGKASLRLFHKEGKVIRNMCDTSGFWGWTWVWPNGELPRDPLW